VFTLEQKIFIVRCYFTNGKRLENGEWSYLTPRVFEEFQQKFPDLPTTCLDYFVFPYLKNNMFKNKPGTIPELMQVITETCNLIDVPTLQRSFENMTRRVTLCFKSHCFIALGEEILLQPTGHT
jgi:hypothetical protein